MAAISSPTASRAPSTDTLASATPATITEADPRRSPERSADRPSFKRELGCPVRPSAEPAGVGAAGIELDIRLLVDHRERLIRSRVAINNDLLWYLHDLWPEIKLPGRPDRKAVLDADRATPRASTILSPIRSQPGP